jgi:hypothetical protein
MEKFNQLLKQARESFSTADHLAYVSFPMIREPKMLYVIAEALHKTAMQVITALLYYEKMYKRIMTIPQEEGARIQMLEKLAPKYKLSNGVVDAVKDLSEIMQKYKESPMTFSRGDKFVMSTDVFNLKMLDANLLKNHVLSVRTLLERVEAIKG